MYGDALQQKHYYRMNIGPASMLGHMDGARTMFLDMKTDDGMPLTAAVIVRTTSPAGCYNTSTEEYTGDGGVMCLPLVEARGI